MSNVLVFAASSDMGIATCKLLRAEGHGVITTARNNHRINADFTLDLSDFSKVNEVFKKLKDANKAINSVVSFAGSLLLKPAHLTSKNDFEKTISSSLTTSFAIASACGGHLKDASVVFISSAAASIGLKNHEAIAAAKAGVEGLVRAAACTYAQKNIRFNAIAPGLTNTRLTKKIIEAQSSLDYSLTLHPLGRVGTVNDIANAVAFLLDEKNAWMTGQILHLDGGLSNLKS